MIAFTAVLFSLHAIVYLSALLHPSLWIVSIWKGVIKNSLSVDFAQLLTISVYTEGAQYMSVDLDGLHGHFIMAFYFLR